MKTFLINPAEIETCWETQDACFVKTKTGKVWICEKYISEQITTKKFIKAFSMSNLIELPLNEKGKSDRDD